MTWTFFWLWFIVGGLILAGLAAWADDEVSL